MEFMDGGRVRVRVRGEEMYELRRREEGEGGEG